MRLNLNYELKGNCENVLVFLHGWGMTGNCFDNVVNCLGNKYSILSLDFFGFGASSEPGDYYDTYEYAYRVYLLISKLKLKNIYIVGHSFGGRVAIILSSVFGIDVKGLCLASSAGFKNCDFKVKIKIWVYKLKKIIYKNNPEKIEKCGSDDYKKLNAIMKKVFVRVVNQDLKFLLHKINIKTLLVWGKRDRSTPISYAKKFQRCIKNSKLKVYGNGGHFAFCCNPYKFSLDLQDFITQK